MNKISELEAKVDACASAVMVLVGLLHERGVAAGPEIAAAWETHAADLAEQQAETGHWLGMLAGKLDRVATAWPAPGTPRPW